MKRIINYYKRLKAEKAKVMMCGGDEHILYVFYGNHRENRKGAFENFKGYMRDPHYMRVILLPEILGTLHTMATGEYINAVQIEKNLKKKGWY